MTSVSLISCSFLGDLAEDGQLPIDSIGWLNSCNFSWGTNEQTLACAHTNRPICQERFDWKFVYFLFFALFLCTQRTPCEINVRQRKHLDCAQILWHAESWHHIREMETFASFHSPFSFLPVQTLVGDGTSKANTAINYSHYVWIEFCTLPIACSS